LENLSTYFNIEHKNPHRALSDAYATAELFLILKQKIFTLPYETIVHLLNLEKFLDSNIYYLLKERENELAFSAETNETITSYRGLAIKTNAYIACDQKEITMSYGDYLDTIYEDNGTLALEKKNY